MAWIYGTGNSISLPIAKYQSAEIFPNTFSPHGFEVSPHEIELLGEKNAFRMSDYHRLDLSIEFFKQKRNHERRWIFSVYNAYWNQNPYFIQLSTATDPETGQDKDVLKEFSILPIIPSFSYSFKF